MIPTLGDEAKRAARSAGVQQGTIKQTTDSTGNVTAVDTSQATVAPVAANQDSTITDIAKNNYVSQDQEPNRLSAARNYLSM